MRVNWVSTGAHHPPTKRNNQKLIGPAEVAHTIPSLEHTRTQAQIYVCSLANAYVHACRNNDVVLVAKTKILIKTQWLTNGIRIYYAAASSMVSFMVFAGDGAVAASADTQSHTHSHA